MTLPLRASMSALRCDWAWVLSCWSWVVVLRGTLWWRVEVFFEV